MKYLKTFIFILIGLLVGSIVNFYAFADKVSVDIQHSVYDMAQDKVIKHQESLNDRIADRDTELEQVKEKHKPYIEDEEKLLEEAKTLLCKEESELASAKMAAFAQKELSLTQQDVQRLSEKVLWTCGEDSPNASLEEEVEIPPTSAVEDPAVFIPEEEKSYDIDCLADAVAVAETGYCQEGSGLTRNNCFGIMAWTAEGKRYLKSYEKNEDSFEDFKRIWEKGYDMYPNMDAADAWTGKDNAATWLGNVNTAYDRCLSKKSN